MVERSDTLSAVLLGWSLCDKVPSAIVFCPYVSLPLCSPVSFLPFLMEASPPQIASLAITVEAIMVFVRHEGHHD